MTASASVPAPLPSRPPVALTDEQSLRVLESWLLQLIAQETAKDYTTLIALMGTTAVPWPAHELMNGLLERVATTINPRDPVDQSDEFVAMLTALFSTCDVDADPVAFLGDRSLWQAARDLNNTVGAQWRERLDGPLRYAFSNLHRVGHSSESIPATDAAERFWSTIQTVYGVGLDSNEHARFALSLMARGHESVVCDMIRITPIRALEEWLVKPSSVAFFPQGSERASLLGALLLHGVPAVCDALDRACPAWPTLLDRHGRNALFYARSVRMAKRLVRAGVDPMQRSITNQTPMDFARSAFPKNTELGDAMSSALSSEDAFDSSIAFKVARLMADKFTPEETVYAAARLASAEDTPWTWTGTLFDVTTTWPMETLWRWGAAHYLWSGGSGGVPEFSEEIKPFVSSAVNGQYVYGPTPLIVFAGHNALVDKKAAALPPNLQGLAHPVGASPFDADVATPQEFLARLLAWTGATAFAPEKVMSDPYGRSHSHNSAVDTIEARRCALGSAVLSDVFSALNTASQDVRARAAAALDLVLPGLESRVLRAAPGHAALIALIQAASRPTTWNNGIATPELGRRVMDSRVGEELRAPLPALLWSRAFLAAQPAWAADRNLPTGPERDARLAAWGPVLRIGLALVGASVFRQYTKDGRRNDDNLWLSPPAGPVATAFTKPRDATRGGDLGLSLTAVEDLLRNMLDNAVPTDKLPARLSKNFSPELRAAADAWSLRMEVGRSNDRMERRAAKAPTPTPPPAPAPAAPVRRRM